MINLSYKICHMLVTPQFGKDSTVAHLIALACIKQSSYEIIGNFITLSTFIVFTFLSSRILLV